MPWKMKKIGDADVLETGNDGNPIWVDDKGKELAVSGTRIPELNAEAARHRQRAETAEASLQAFAGLEPDKAREAVEKLALIDQSKLIEAGKLDEAVNARTSQYKTQLEQKDADLKKLQADVKAEKIANAFSSSEFGKKLVLPPDMAQKALGDRFDVRDGKVVALDANGNPLISAKNMGETASFEEAYEIIISQHPQKDTLLKGQNHGGSGNDGNGGTNVNKKTLSRAEFDKLPPDQRLPFTRDVAAGKAALVD